MSSTRDVLYAVRDQIAWITLNRPEAINAVRNSLEMDLPAGLRAEADRAALITSTEDRVEAGKAFREKRRPVFKGR